jgi:hypothetical protein
MYSRSMSRQGKTEGVQPASAQGAPADAGLLRTLGSQAKPALEARGMAWGHLPKCAGSAQQLGRAAASQAMNSTQPLLACSLHTDGRHCTSPRKSFAQPQPQSQNPRIGQDACPIMHLHRRHRRHLHRASGAVDAAVLPVPIPVLLPVRVRVPAWI